MSDPAAAICRFADTFHRAAGTDHHLASPLGAWLVLALVGPAAAGASRSAIERALGSDVEQAAGFARALLATPHPVVQLAVAAWHDPPVETAELASWLGALGAHVERGPVPSQDVADAWTREHTAGLIERFPVTLRDVVLALTSALATKISWDQPFAPTPATALALPRSAGFSSVRGFLADATGRRTRAIASTPVGLVAVHTAVSRGNELAVTSVIAEPGVPAADVLAAAHPLALASANRLPVPGAVPLADLPLGQGHSWTLTEHVDHGPAPSHEQYRAILPAWSASGDYSLLEHVGLGFRAAADVLAALLGRPDLVPAARQVAVARYTRTGFEAAAVTTLARATSAFVGGEVVVRRAALEFTHPFAVVAVATGDEPWRGLPVFSGWVTRADEDDPARPG